MVCPGFSFVVCALVLGFAAVPKVGGMPTGLGEAVFPARQSRVPQRAAGAAVQAISRQEEESKSAEAVATRKIARLLGASADGDNPDAAQEVKPLETHVTPSNVTLLTGAPLTSQSEAPDDKAASDDDTSTRLSQMMDASAENTAARVEDPNAPPQEEETPTDWPGQARKNEVRKHYDLKRKQAEERRLDIREETRVLRQGAKDMDSSVQANKELVAAGDAQAKVSATHLKYIEAVSNAQDLAEQKVRRIMAVYDAEVKQAEHVRQHNIENVHRVYDSDVARAARTKEQSYMVIAQEELEARRNTRSDELETFKSAEAEESEQLLANHWAAKKKVREAERVATKAQQDAAADTDKAQTFSGSERKVEIQAIANVFQSKMKQIIKDHDVAAASVKAACTWPVDPPHFLDEFNSIP